MAESSGPPMPILSSFMSNRILHFQVNIHLPRINILFTILATRSCHVAKFCPMGCKQKWYAQLPGNVFKGRKIACSPSFFFPLEGMWTRWLELQLLFWTMR